MDPEVGQVINGRFRLKRRIGEGGMGAVFMAEHALLGTTNALKFLHPHLARNELCTARFLREAQINAQVNNGHVVRAMDVERAEDGTPFLVMEYVEGTTLLEEYERMRGLGTWLDSSVALGYMLQIFEGVEAAHARGVVHRDLNPANVIVERREDGGPLLRILDFGVAKMDRAGMDALTGPGMVMGTPEYMPPEQAYTPANADARADVFALGVMLYEMLSGSQPAQGPIPAIVEAFLNSNYPTLHRVLDLDPDLVAAVHRAIAPDPDDRFATIAEFRAAILPCVPEEVLASLPQTVSRERESMGWTSTCDVPSQKRTLFEEPLLGDVRQARGLRLAMVCGLVAFLCVAFAAAGFSPSVAKRSMDATMSAASFAAAAAPIVSAPEEIRTLEAKGTVSGKQLLVRYAEQRTEHGRGHFEVQLLEDGRPLGLTRVRVALKHFSTQKRRAHTGSDTFDVPLYRDGNYHLFVTARTRDGETRSRCTICIGDEEVCPARTPARCVPR